MFSVLSHLYGRDGRDTKKADQKSLIFDFEFFTQLIEPTFIDALTASIASFITQINENQSPGKTRSFFQFFLCLTHFFCFRHFQKYIFVQR